MTMNTKPQHTLAEIGKAYSTAIIWVSRNRYTYATILETIADIAMDIRRDVMGDPPHGVHQIYDGQSKPNKLSLIRALCDRIELKLMEAAK